VTKVSRALLFDLDGTLTDPKQGITRSIQYALETLGEAVPAADDLLWCIGPPLQESFARLLGGPGRVDRAMTLYRERFSDKGLFENTVYPGITDMLEASQADGFELYVATSKPHVFANRIVEHFDLARFFTGVFGSELDGTRREKPALIAHLLGEQRLDPANCVMIGDREHDILGARANNVATVAVTWGYGTPDELAAAKPDATCDAPEELPPVLRGLLTYPFDSTHASGSSAP
jgi:phosphoglycolate phosphatase